MWGKKSKNGFNKRVLGLNSLLKMKNQHMLQKFPYPNTHCKCIRIEKRELPCIFHTKMSINAKKMRNSIRKLCFDCFVLDSNKKVAVCNSFKECLPDQLIEPSFTKRKKRKNKTEKRFSL